MPVWGTEQYPRGLGPATAAIAELIPDRPAKTSFHCCAIPQFLEQLYGRNIRHITVVGIEAHVCVAQTALELLTANFRVQVPADAVSSRHAFDRDVALRRLELAGAVVTTTEAAIFEWVETADHPQFKAISGIIKEADLARSAAKSGASR
jgi:nicotinamidase-related amidase